MDELSLMPVSMIMLLHGEDTYRSRQRLRILREGFQKKYDAQGHNIAEFAAEDLDLQKLFMVLSAQGLFVSKRLTIVKNILTQGKADQQEQILKFLQKQPLSEDAILIFWEGANLSGGIKKIGAKPKKSGSKAAKKIGAGKQNQTAALMNHLLAQHVEQYNALNLRQVTDWVHQEAVRYTSSFEPRAVQALLGLVGLQLWQLQQEIMKLAHYAKGRAVTEQDVLFLVQANFTENIFAFMDALSTKQQSQALRLLHAQLASGLTEPYLLTMLARQVRIMLQVKSAQQMSQQPGVLATQLGLHPFVVKKTLGQVGRFSLEKLKNMYAQIVTIDNLLKTSGVAPRALLELFVVKACV